MRTPILAGLGLALLACTTKLADPLDQTGSSTITTGADRSRAYAVNVDEGTVSRLDASAGEVAEIAVGAAPTRIARSDGKLLVTLRGERGIAVIDEASFSVDEVLATGNEPVGIVVDQHAKHFYVACSLSGTVEEWDAATLEKVREFTVPGEPRWLALHPNGKVLYAVSAQGKEYHWVDLAKGKVHAESFPTVEQYPLDEGIDMVMLTSRGTGDPAVSVDGHRLAIPAFYTDNLSREPGTPENTVPARPYYSGAVATGSRFNPVLVEVDLGTGGRPHPKSAVAVLVTDYASVPFDDRARPVHSYLSSITASPDSMSWVVTMEASDAVIWVPLKPGDNFSFNGVGAFEYRDTSVATTDGGPRGVAFRSEEEALTHAFLERTIVSLNAETMTTLVHDEITGFDTATGIFEGEGIPIAESSLTVEEEMGRRLFYTAGNGTMGSEGGGVSCSTCHFDGRNDGLTWPLFSGDRNTPSIAGGISDTQPVTWTNQVATVGEEASFTNLNRMGGSFLGPDREAQIQAYVDLIPRPDVAQGDPAAIARGEAVFEASGCAECHGGAPKTDNLTHEMFGLAAVNTPTLRGVSTSAPYLHDGSATSLLDVIRFAQAGSMGEPFSLSSGEERDLETYLRSL